MFPPQLLTSRRLRVALLLAFVLALLGASLPARAPLALLPGDICSSTQGKAPASPMTLAHCPDCLPAPFTPPVFALALRQELRHTLAPLRGLRAAPISVTHWPPARGPPMAFVFSTH